VRQVIELVNSLTIAHAKNMSIFVKRSNQYKVRDAEYRPWNMRDVVEAYSGKSYEEVIEEQKRKRESKQK